jgi:hypothetical protein
MSVYVEIRDISYYGEDSILTDLTNTAIDKFSVFGLTISKHVKTTTCCLMIRALKTELCKPVKTNQTRTGHVNEISRILFAVVYEESGKYVDQTKMFHFTEDLIKRLIDLEDNYRGNLNLLRCKN